MQQHFDLIPHPVQGGIIYQRPKDGYINATAMCQAAGKQFGHYRENKVTKDFLTELSSAIGIPIAEMVHSVVGGDFRFQGTWVHPQVAIHLGQWVSAPFAVQVTQWVYEWMSGAGPATVKDTVPYHLRRYVANQPNVPVAHFSVLTEMTQLLIAPMEIMGYTLPEHMLPDISHGKMFCKWLREVHGIDTDALPTYLHVYEDGRRVWPKAYPEQLLADFRKHFREEWLPNRAIDYFRGRDGEALQYLPKLIANNKPKKLN
ncbi:KilA-N domain-containing protein [Bradyrhizobium sp. 150]|uniref:KilA-N domain-containing protein n=1 Tax=Bradyrhizobium sp. 150 TaxID=2782625 RepID=UPI001FFA6122|nr:KilA-N domain-containing protein [Bradyrhizobium sp. 150]MCK1672780.1 KilA-N domain-containing protein [Bradyrhizobium sp. 150]